jgi:hypothetical protein
MTTKPWTQIFEPRMKLHLIEAMKDIGVVASVTAITSAITLNDTHFIITCDASSAAFTVTLPAASKFTGRVYHIKKTDSSGNAVTVDGNMSETIDGDTTKVIATQYDSMMIVSNGSNWYII